ncbi:MAG: DUF1049 domain-containing protein [Treponema sp.]|uniref:hypothetical protein n=1 Tax=Treponema sp. TaxID=166 RepID=UPI0025F80B0F|nr:hypothetical protein [Treponema sp.]MBQ9280634.1 DUF1049 domain-containing protein [Treponema sp.]
MPIRLIGSIILLVLVTIFAGVNLDNKCDITFIFYTFEQVPVFMTVIVSFAIGAILMLPFTLGRKKKKTQKAAQTQKPSDTQNKPKEESKTLFDFKIKREAKPEKTKTENPQKNKKSLFGFRKAKADSENTASATSGNQADSSESTGEPV